MNGQLPVVPGLNETTAAECFGQGSVLRTHILQHFALVSTAEVWCFTFHCVLSNVTKHDTVLSERRAYAHKINSSPDPSVTDRFLQR